MNQTEREDRWREICREFRDSGMTQKAFSELRGIARSTLGYWLARVSGSGESSQSNAALVAVGTVELSRAAVLRIGVGGTMVAELDLPADETVIRDVLRAAASL